jgi:hypothetical protein
MGNPLRPGAFDEGGVRIGIDASDLIVTNLQKILPAGGRPHMGVSVRQARAGEAVANLRSGKRAICSPG